MTNPETIDHLVMLAEMGREDQVRDALRRLHPADAAELLDAVENDALRARLFAHLDTPRAAAALSLLGDQSRETLLDTLPEQRLRAFLAALESDDAADLLAELPRAQVERLLRAIPPRLSADVRDLLRYDEESAGGIMQREFVALPAEATVDDAIDAVRRRAADVPDIHNIFVVDAQQKLIGALPLRLLILANPRTPLRNIMQAGPVVAHPGMDQEEVAGLFSKYDLLSLPVVDAGGRLVGRITVDDVVDVIEEEASEDIYRLAGLGDQASVHESVRDSVRRRLPWLIVNLGTCFLSASVVAFFEGTIRSLAIAAAFMTMVAGSGGNAGVQTLALVVRGLALGELTFLNARRVLAKEIMTGALNGLALGLVAAVFAYLWKGVPLLGLVVSLAILGNLCIAALVAVLIPLGLKWCGIDPAVASAVVLTTFTDCCGFFFFLGLLTLLR
ncbi:MAG: magnesium transporter [Deltaproteobacteria bacterium]|nr:magnesium transporter [Deltaproteobacteria bacterium]